MKAETKFIRQIQKLSENEEFQKKHIRNTEKDFKRTRKLRFSDVIMYSIGNTKSPLELEAEKFSRYIEADSVSGAALCKARQKVNYTAFEELFEITAVSSPREKRFRGYYLYAVDGMKGELPKTPELSEKYRISPQSEQPVFHAVSVYDVLNELFIRSKFHFGTADERELADKMIDSVMQDENYKEEAQIWLFDRGFPSLQLMYHLLEQKRKFVMRVSSNFLKEVNEFRRSKYIDRQISVTCTKRRIRSAQIQCEENMVLNLRCVRIQLSSGAEEILITNLERAEFPKRDLNKLYSLRWGIETSFNYLKNAVFVEEFTSRTENGLAQEYFVSLLMYNFSTCMFGSMQKDIPKKESTNTR